MVHLLHRLYGVDAPASPYRKVIVSVHIFLRVFPYLPTAFAVWRMFLEIRYAHDVIRVKIADQ